MRDRDEFEYEFILGKLSEIEEALATLEARPDALELASERTLLVEEAARLTAALAEFDRQRTIT